VPAAVPTACLIVARGRAGDGGKQIWTLDALVVPFIEPQAARGEGHSHVREDDATRFHGRPEIFNTDQGSQFTSDAFTELLLENGIDISMDGKGAWRDNVFFERFWRTVKYEEVYIRAYDSVAEARSSIGRYVEFYNGHRPHSSLDRRTPDQAYYASLPLCVAA
jgi:transposase InsO family protein